MHTRDPDWEALTVGDHTMMPTEELRRLVERLAGDLELRALVGAERLRELSDELADRTLPGR